MSQPPELETKSTADSQGRARSKWGRRLLMGLLAIAAALAVTLTWFFARYQVEEETLVEVTEFSHFEYAEDPAGRSPFHSQYDGRRLRLVQRDATHFDFVFEPLQDHVATVTFKNVDVSLMTPGLPDYAAEDDGLRRIALTDREWNRQQVQFDAPGEHVEVSGGDGWESDHLAVASLAKNCLNAGLWEVLFFTKSDSGKQLYYQGWFTFPIGQYKRLWEANTEQSYWADINFWRMEHWVDPEGSLIPLEKLREVSSEREIEAHFDPAERPQLAGEQVRKRRTTRAPGVRDWSDFIERRRDVRFATFRPPGVYDVEKPWGNRYELIERFTGATHRRIRSRLDGAEYDELELRYEGAGGQQSRLFIGGLSLDDAPRLSPEQYPEGLYLPMGIGVPPFYQSYKDLQASPPDESPYYSFVLNEAGEWLDHHTMAIDGPVLHRDAADPTKLHLYLLSYERHQLIAHYEMNFPGGGESSSTSREPVRAAIDAD